MRTRKGTRVYAIGDVHGRHDLLVELLTLIVNHWEASLTHPRRVELIFLGDVIDRGPDSARCLELVADLVERGAAMMLKGNHEDMLLESVSGNPAAIQAWLRHGGLETLASYSIDPPREGEDTWDFTERLLEQIPSRHLDVLRAAPTSHRCGTYFFVHAGVKPGIPLDKQRPVDLYSIRREFTGCHDWHGAMIVHGHEIVDKGMVLPNRIACDTGAYASGHLTCACLEDETISFIET
ncbi:MAG: metallophosphoesterase [Erythrobacter sp.]